MKYLIHKFNKSVVIFCLSTCILILILSACGPSPEEIVEQTDQAATSTASSWTPMPTATLTPTPTPEPIIPNGGILFINLGTWGSSPQMARTGSGAFKINLNSQDITKILDSDQNLEAVSLDGNQIVYSQGNELYLKDIGENNSFLLADNFTSRGASGSIANSRKVMWFEETNEIGFVGINLESEIPGIYICNTDGSNLHVITGSRDRPIGLLDFYDNGVFWEFGYIRQDPEYGEVTHSEGVRHTTLDGVSKSHGVPKFTYSFALSSNGEKMLYSPSTGMRSPIYIRNMEDDSRITFLGKDCVDPDLQEVWAGLSQGDLIDSYAVWSSDSDSLLFGLSIRNIETWEATYSSQTIYSNEGEKIFALPESGATDLGPPVVTWSPDSKYFLVGSFDYVEIWDAVNFKVVHNVYLPSVLNEIDIFGEIDKIFWVE